MSEAASSSVAQRLPLDSQVTHKKSDILGQLWWQYNNFG